MLDAYRNNLGNVPVYSQNEKLELWNLANNGDKVAFNKLVECMLPYTYSIANKFRGAPKEDLISEANLILLYAIKTWKPQANSNQVNFTSWIKRVVTHRLIRYLNNVEHGGIYVPESTPNIADAQKAKSITYLNYDVVHKSITNSGPCIADIISLLNKYTNFKERVAFRYKYGIDCEKLPVKIIAARLDITEFDVRRTLNIARKKIQRNRICEYCQQSFITKRAIGYNEQKFCSKRCALKQYAIKTAQNNLKIAEKLPVGYHNSLFIVEKQCKICKAKFTTKSKATRAIYCSKKCKLASYRIRTCKNCGIKFRHKRKRRFCNYKCSYEYLKTKGNNAQVSS